MIRIPYTLVMKLIKKFDLSKTDCDIYLTHILNEIRDRHDILYDFEAIEYCRIRIHELKELSIEEIIMQRKR